MRTLCLAPWLYHVQFAFVILASTDTILFREKVLFKSDFNKINIDFPNLVKSLREGSLVKSACIPLVSALWSRPELHSENLPPEDSSSVPSTHIGYFIIACHSAAVVLMPPWMHINAHTGEEGWTIKLNKILFLLHFIVGVSYFGIVES